MQTTNSYISLTSLPLPESIGGSSRSFQKQSNDVGQDQRGQPGGRGGQGKHGWFWFFTFNGQIHSQKIQLQVGWKSGAIGRGKVKFISVNSTIEEIPDAQPWSKCCTSPARETCTLDYLNQTHNVT